MNIPIFLCCTGAAGEGAAVEDTAARSPVSRRRSYA